jgi:hypothetical protein
MWADLSETDATKTYVEWAIKNDFAVIDVNIPSHITNEGVRTCVPIWKKDTRIDNEKRTLLVTSSQIALISEPQPRGNLQLTSGRTTSSLCILTMIPSAYLLMFFSRVNDSTDIILMGIGAAYAGVVWLLSNEGMKPKTG